MNVVRSRSVFLRFIPVAFLLVVMASPLDAQIIFIDPASLRETNGNGIQTFASLQVNAAVLRFTPKDTKAPFKPELTRTGSFDAVVSELGEKGQIDVLYYGSRSVLPGTGQAAIFNSIEKRSAFWSTPKENRTSTNRSFGLTLSVQGSVVTNNVVDLNWTGNLCWSPQFLNTWAGDKYLMFGMKLAKFVPGMSYTVDEEEEFDEDSGAGINLKKVFRSKKKKEEDKQKKLAEQAKPPIDFSFIEAEERKVEITGKQSLNQNELVILSRESEAGKEENEYIFLLLQPVLVEN